MRIALWNLVLCTAPYLGLRVYLSQGMHDGVVAAAFSAPWLLGSLFVLGVVVPTAGVFWTLRWVIRDRLHFRLSGLLEAYGVLIVLFASSYAIIQASAEGTRSSAMAPLSRIGMVLTAVEGLAGIGFVGVALGHYFSVCLRRGAEQG